jgi:hypothetical protein
MRLGVSERVDVDPMYYPHRSPRLVTHTLIYAQSTAYSYTLTPILVRKYRKKVLFYFALEEIKILISARVTLNSPEF